MRNTVALYVSHVIALQHAFEETLDLVHDGLKGRRGSPRDLAALELAALQHGLGVRIYAQDHTGLARVRGDDLQPRVLVEAAVALVALLVNLDLDVELGQNEEHVRALEGAAALHGAVPLPSGRPRSICPFGYHVPTKAVATA
jgi:hypothetical protein